LFLSIPIVTISTRKSTQSADTPYC
jgi:hypothetical protein